jgi:DNA-directed RNA polymerase sigma subunit (sigma70/sigma32)
MERQKLFGEIIDKAIYDLDAATVRVLKKRFGIGYPYQLTVNEIAENEGLSQSKVKYMLAAAFQTIQQNISDEDKKTIMELLE